MNDESLEGLPEAAAGYEALLVPALFGQWARPVLEAARVQPGDRVLDVACGTGVLAREAAARAGASALIAGIDAAPGMLAVAERLAPRIEWRQGMAEALPYADGSFDAVVSQFGLMFFTDRRKALREMLRVLAPHGRLAVAVWDALDNIPAYAAEVALLERLAGLPAADAVRMPFVLGSPKELTALFEDAGVQSVAVTTRSGTARFPSVKTMLEADLRGWLPLVGVALSEDRIRQVLGEGERTLGRYITTDGCVEFALSAHVVTGRKP